MRWNQEWITEEDLYPRVSEESYEDIENITVYEYWDYFEDIYQEDLKYERRDK